MPSFYRHPSFVFLDRTGSTALHVVGNPHTERFYLTYGFKMVGTAETRFGVGLLLQKLL
jgi:hypothetical protein